VQYNTCPFINPGGYIMTIIRANIDDKVIEKIIKLGQVIEVFPGEKIQTGKITQGQWLLPIKGRLRLSYGDEKSQEILHSDINATFPVFELPIGDTVVPGYQLTALERGQVLILPLAAFREIVQKTPEMVNILVQDLITRLKEVDEKNWAYRRRENLYARLLTEEKQNKHKELAGGNHKIIQYRKLINQLAPLRQPLYLTGEKGTGKELLAWLIHRGHEKNIRPFITVECRDMLDDDLGERIFGGTGGFTQGIGLNRFGYLELASGGTLILKDFDLLNPLVLIRLASYMEDNSLDVRIMITSLEPAVLEINGADPKNEKFNQLLTNPLILPPLRDRMRDIPLLCSSILGKLAKKHQYSLPAITREAQEKLLNYKYTQSNVAELEEILERALILSDGGEINAEAIFTGVILENPGIAFDVLQLSSIKRLIKNRIYPRIPQVAASFGLWIFILAAFGSRGGIVGALVLGGVWSIGWPALLLSAALAGRFTCSICPIAGTADMVQKRFSFNRPVPRFLIQYDYLIMSLLFSLIFWVEEVSGIRKSPLATGILLLIITLGAVFTAVYYPRHTWCRHICPLGGMVSVCSMVAPLELRSKAEICRYKCTTYDCYKGSKGVPGCPLSQHLSFVDNNIACKLCMNCVLSCPHNAIMLNIRPPAREIWLTRHINRGMVIFVLTFGAQVIPVLLYDKYLFIHNSTATFSIIFWAIVFGTGFAGWWAIRNFLTEEEAMPRIRIILCQIPLVFAAQFAYQLQFIPMLPNLLLYSHHLMNGVVVGQLGLISLLSLLRILVLTAGFILTLICIGMSRRELTASEKNYSLLAFAGASYYLLTTSILLYR
jgi:transcriptional regulator with AAA-type ATPase domain/ferredoxin